MVLLQSVSPPSDGVRHEQAETTAVLDSEKLGTGTLCVAETRVAWFDDSGVGFSLEYPSISLHAISRDLSAYPEEHLYVVVNARRKDINKGKETEEKYGGNDVDEDEEEEEDGDDDEYDDDDDDDGEDRGLITEIRFVPNDKASLEPMFSAMSECQALHPDADDSDSDFEGDEYDVEEAEQGQIDLPTFYSFEEGLSQLSMEDQGPLARVEGAKQHCMAGVGTDDAAEEPSSGAGEMKADACALGPAGQFEDADVDHW